MYEVIKNGLFFYKYNNLTEQIKMLKILLI